MVLILAACAALGAFPAATEGEQVVCEWDFARCMQGWIPNGTAHVKPDKDGIVIETDGRDPQLIELQAEHPTASGGCPRSPDGCIPCRRDPVVLANRHDRPVRRVIPGTEPACLGGGIRQRSGRRGPAVLEDRQTHYRSAVGPPGRRSGRLPDRKFRS